MTRGSCLFGGCKYNLDSLTLVFLGMLVGYSHPTRSLLVEALRYKSDGHEFDSR